MCANSTYQHMLNAMRARIDKGYSAESAHAAVTRDWQTTDDDACELFADALDYQILTYGSYDDV